MIELKNILGSEGQSPLFDEIIKRINDRLSITEKSILNKNDLCDTTCMQTFLAFKKEVETVIENFRLAIEHSSNERLKLLFYHKMLEALLYQNNDGLAIVNCYTYRWFLDDLFIKRTVRGQLKVTGALSNLAEYARYSPAKELIKEWHDFINSIAILQSNNSTTTQEIENLNSFLMLLEKIEGVSTWFATTFYQAISVSLTNKDALAQAALKKFNEDYSAGSREFILFTESIHDNLTTIKTALEQKLDTVKAAEALWNEVNRLLINPLTTDQFISEFANTTFLNKFLILKEIADAIELIDISIKKTKSASSLSLQDREILFEKMLTDFWRFCQRLLSGIMPSNSLQYHQNWSLESYITTTTELFNAIFTHYKTPVDAMDAPPQPSFFQKSPAFSVQAAILGSQTAFERHYPQTPEDLFMLVHQNSLVAVSATYTSLFRERPVVDLIYIPLNLRTIFEYVGSDSSILKSLIGITYNEKNIVFSYNMPLRNHSATFQIGYDCNTQEIKFYVQYLGEARDRWEQIAVLAALSPELSHLTLEDTVIFDHTGGLVSWTWKVENVETIKIILSYLSIMNSLSFKLDLKTMFELKHTDITKIPDSFDTIIQKMRPLLPQKIKGALRLNW